MRPSRCLSLIFTVIVLASCSVREPGDTNKPFPQNLQGEFTITGAYALSPFIRACADSFCVRYPDVRIIIESMGSELALKHLQNGKCDLAMISRPITDQEEESYFAIAVARTGAVIIFNSNNPYKEDILNHGFTIHDLQKVYSSSENLYWDDYLGKKGNIRLNAYDRLDPCGTAEMLAGFLFMQQDEMVGIEVDGEDNMISSVIQDSLALGYCNVNDAFDLATGTQLNGIEFLSVDLNMNGLIEDREIVCGRLNDFQKSICNSTYPFRLTRNLYLVAPEKPQKELSITFLKWVLTDGQTLVKPMGYSDIPASLLKYNRYLLK